MLLRPYGVIINGHLELGLEVEVVDGTMTKVSPQSGMPDSYVLSPAFPNADTPEQIQTLLQELKEKVESHQTTAEKAWQSATTPTEITPNQSTPLLKLHFQSTPHQTQDLLEQNLQIELV